ncbi:MAG TPA: beta-L-arabinofuranosidase domain-containing protein [Chitinophagaceae bacterium]
MKLLWFFCLLLFDFSANAQTLPWQQIYSVGFEKVQITDKFWKPKMDKVATATLGACIYQTEVKTPRIRNFEKVANKTGEKHEGIYYDDSDVYKALEAIAYSLKNRPDNDLEKKADEWIDKIAAAQLPDGYINTYYTLGDLGQRWTDMEKHEDYNAGHLIEAAVAYYNTTGKKKLLDVAIRFADHIDSTFRLNNRNWVSGHQEIELALMKLYHLTSKERYLLLADWFLDQRGRGYGKGVIWDMWKDPKYCQDSVPVKSQREITGHAVRAMYMYTGAADVAAVTSDLDYMKAMKAVWEDVVYRNMYITGGIGSSGSNEGFSVDYDLPNENAYCETCASVGMVFWNHRMNLLTGESKYIDVLERSLYNGALSGLSQTGDRFFYGNPLASKGQHFRREWFGTACCPSNIARLVSSVGEYIYGQTNNGIWINLFISSNTSFAIDDKTKMNIRMITDYPWNGKVKLMMDPTRPVTEALRIRMPGWMRSEAVPGNLYRFIDSTSTNVDITINGKSANYSFDDRGYAILTHKWKKGDVVEFELPMPARLVSSRKEVKQNINRLAIQRGPLVYCVESTDNGQQAWNILMEENSIFSPHNFQLGTEEVIALKGELPIVTVSADGKAVQTERRTVTAIPYYSWANRGQAQMQVWLPTVIQDIKLNY